MPTRMFSHSRAWLTTALVATVSLIPLLAWGEHSLRCHHCSKSCQTHQLVEKTIMVPKRVVETQGKNCVVMKTEERDEIYTVFVMKPAKRTYKNTRWYLDDMVKEQKILKIEPKLVSVPVHRSTHIKLPYSVIGEELRCREECGTCGPICVCEVCPVEKTYMQDGRSESDLCEKQLVIDKTLTDAFYCVKVPKSYSITCAEENYFELVPVERTRKVSVCIPKIEKQNIEVEVTRMVACKVLVCETCSHR